MDEQTTLSEATSSSRRDGDLTASEWNRLRKERLKIDDDMCVNCGKGDTQLHVHHIVPDSKGGTTTVGNLRTLCHSCHRKVHIGDSSVTYSDPDPINAPYVPMIRTLRRIIGNIAHPLDQIIWLLLAKTGMQVQELTSLNTSDLYLKSNSNKNPKIGPKSIKPDHILVSEKISEGIPGARGNRLIDVKIPIDTETEQALQKWLVIRPDPDPSLDRDPLLLSTSRNYGTAITGQSVHHTVEKWAKRFGHYKTGAGSNWNITPSTLYHFFSERFLGQPATRDYILGKRDDMPFSFYQLATDYREGVPRLLHHQ